MTQQQLLTVAEPCPGIKFEEDKGTYKIDLIRTVDGRRVHIYASNIADYSTAVKTKEKLLQERIRESQLKVQNQMSFQDFFKQYKNYRRLHVRESSIRQAETVVHKYFGGDYEASAGNVLSYPSMIGIYRKVVHDEHLSDVWKNKIIGVLRSFNANAFKWKVIDSETYQDVMGALENIPESHRRAEKLIWSASEEKRFLSCIEDPFHKVMFTLFMELGARLGEFLGLTWDVYDAKKGCIKICKQLINASQKNYVLSDKLKTKDSYRVCKLSKPTKTLLDEYHATRASNIYMFPSLQNASLPFSKAAFRKQFEKYIALSKVRRITPHAIRHAKATKLLRVCRNMLEVKAIARFMGHSASILMDIYSHSEDATIEAVLKRLE